MLKVFLMITIRVERIIDGESYIFISLLTQRADDLHWFSDGLAHLYDNSWNELLGENRMTKGQK